MTLGTTRGAGLLAAALLLVVGCGGKEQSRREAPPSSGPAPGTATTPAGGTTGGGPPRAAPRATVDAKGCVHDGRWRPCALVDRLEHAGLVVTPEKDTVRYDFLSVPGLRYTVGRGEVQAFFYDDTTRLARDLADTDTLRVTRAGTYRHWDVHPTLVRSGNLIVILLTLSDQLVERVQLATQAGAPQPDPDSSAAPQALPPARVP